MKLPREPARVREIPDPPFVPDSLIGKEPEKVKRGLKAAYARLLALSFDHVLLAHGQPWVGGAKQALRRFLRD